LQSKQAAKEFLRDAGERTEEAFPEHIVVVPSHAVEWELRGMFVNILRSDDKDICLLFYWFNKQPLWY
jgi:aromatic ring-opening dioxygenase catalytic subunit (LigB family)